MLTTATKQLIKNSPSESLVHNTLYRSLYNYAAKLNTPELRQAFIADIKLFAAQFDVPERVNWMLDTSKPLLSMEDPVIAELNRQERIELENRLGA